MKYKILASSLVMVLILGSLTFAEAPITLDYSSAVVKAIENSTNLKQMELGLDSLNKSHAAAETGGKAQQSYLDDLKRYQRILKKISNNEELTDAEKGKHRTLHYMFGGTYPNLTKEEEYNNYVKTIEITHYGLYTQIYGMREDIRVLKATLNNSVADLFIGLQSLEGNIEGIERALELSKTTYDQTKSKYELGLMTEVDLYAADVNVQKATLNLEIMKRSKLDLYDNIKKLCGLDASSELIVNYKTYVNTYYGLKDFEDYLEIAYAERGDMKKAQLNYDAAVREENIMKQYVTNDKLEERIDLSISIVDKKIVLEEAKNSVYQELYTSYKATLVNKIDLDLKVENYKVAETSYMDTKKMFELGLVSKIAVDAQLSEMQSAFSNMQSSLRTYSGSYDKLLKQSNSGLMSMM